MYLKILGKRLYPLAQLLLWSVLVCLFCFIWYKIDNNWNTKDKNRAENIHEGNEAAVKERVEEESFYGNNIYNYIELIRMPAETAFQKIRVLITNKSNNSIFYDWKDYEKVKSEIEKEKYRGEIIYQKAAKDEDGFVVINEVNLEEYLYGVVPSEMPASYPMEALKAQAVCARTYAVLHMMNPAYPDYNAHVNDTTSYQVYHNIPEQQNTNRAVDETAGLLLFEGNGRELVETYYYSTSCGLSCEASTNVEFREYISSSYSSDFEAQESWYRWTCQNMDLDTRQMLKRMKDRYRVNKNHVLTMTSTDQYEALAIQDWNILKDLFISKRGDGGVGEELIIVTDKNTYKVVGEYNIRYILNDPDVEIVKQDGKIVTFDTLLPSAFIALDVVKIDKQVAGYQIIGGGYGHGVGMSQNAAKGMAGQGYTMEDILAYFYPGSQVLTHF